MGLDPISSVSESESSSASESESDEASDQSDGDSDEMMGTSFKILDQMHPKLLIFLTLNIAALKNLIPNEPN